MGRNRAIPQTSNVLSKTQQKVSKRKKRRDYKKKFFFIAIIFLLSGILLMRKDLMDIGNQCNYFKLKEISIKGNNRISLEQIKSLVDIREGLNILSLDLHRITGLAEAHPWIRSLEVERRFPNFLSIEVEESSPIALWEDEGRFFSIDEYGIILEEVKAASSYSQLPILTGFRSGPCIIGNKCPLIYWADGLSVIESIKKVFPLLMGDIVKCYIATEDQMIILLKEGKMIFLKTDDVEYKISLLKAIVEKVPEQWESMNYCDIRFKYKIIFG